MAEYYLISQLPSLDGISDGMPIPITEDGFLELCRRNLGKKTLGEIEKLTLTPSPEEEKSASSLVDSWCRDERNLRIALAKARADRMGREFVFEKRNIPSEILKTAKSAVEIENPLEAEKFLLCHRLLKLEEARPMNSFSDEYLFYYALKLKLLMRIRAFDREIGEATYKNIYDSVLSGDKLEAE